MRAAVLEDLYPNPTRNLKAGEKDKLAGEKKEKELAQDHMDTQIHDLITDSPEAGKGASQAVNWREVAEERTGRLFSFERTKDDATRNRQREAARERDDD